MYKLKPNGKSKNNLLHKHFKLRGNCWKDEVTFTAHFGVTIKHLTRYKQKVVLVAMLFRGQEYALQHMAVNITTSLKNRSAKEYFPLMHFISNFGCKVIFMHSINFLSSHNSKSLFKESIGHMTSSCEKPIAPHSDVDIHYTFQTILTKQLMQKFWWSGVYTSCEEVNQWTKTSMKAQYTSTLRARDNLIQVSFFTIQSFKWFYNLFTLGYNWMGDL